MERMFDTHSFSGLKSAAEVKAAVQYLAKNEIKFRQELTSEGLNYDSIQQELKNIWQNLLTKCTKFKYSDYIVSSKKAIYGVK